MTGLRRAGQAAVLVVDLREIDRRLRVAREGRRRGVGGVEAEAAEDHRQDNEPESGRTEGVITTRGTQVDLLGTHGVLRRAKL